MMWLKLVLVLLLVLEGVSGEPGRWDHHRRRKHHHRPPAPPRTTPPPTKTPPKTTKQQQQQRPDKQWTHSLTSRPPLHRCQATPHAPLPAGLQVNAEYLRGVENLLLEDKLLLAPVVFEGAMVSRTNTYKGLYFVSFKVIKVVKGRLNPQLNGHVRLLFQTEQLKRFREGGRQLKGNACPPVPFNVRSGRKYLIFVKKLWIGRYVAVAGPEVVRKKARKALLKTFCPGCVVGPDVRPLAAERTVQEGRPLRLKCKLGRVPHPPPAIRWLKDGRPIHKHTNINIQTKKKRSNLVISSTTTSDAGMYTCEAVNLVGSSQTSSLVTIRQNGGIRAASECPIERFCLNGGACLYYEMIGELVCRCQEGFAGQRCQFKKARIRPSTAGESACGPYGHDIELAEICAAWNSPPIKEMTRDEYQAWIEVEEKLKNFKISKGKIANQLVKK